MACATIAFANTLVTYLFAIENIIGIGEEGGKKVSRWWK
jgi:hypothetical protein